MKPELDPKLLRSMAPFLLNALLAQKNLQDLTDRYNDVLMKEDYRDPDYPDRGDRAFTEWAKAKQEADRLMDSTLRAILGPNYSASAQ